MRTVYIYNNVMTVVAFIGLFLSLFKVCAIISADKEKDTDKPVLVVASCVAVAFAVVIIILTVVSHIEYSAIKDRVKDTYPGAHNFKSVEKNVSSFEDGNDEKHFFEYDPDKNAIIIQESKNVIKDAL